MHKVQSMIAAARAFHPSMTFALVMMAPVALVALLEGARLLA